ncbi:MAG: hypothetical protein M3065_19575 [Actinomycetota bacterium]|nr:hypothetical protein [Actinomycetota bacterium]
MATVAVFLALGGSAVAARRLLAGSSIKPGSIPANRLKKHSVTGLQVDLRHLGTVPSATAATRAASADQLAGHSPSALLGRTVVVVKHGPPTATGSYNHADAMCPAGYEVTGGGVSVDNVINDKVTGSSPLLADATQNDPFLATDGQHTAGNGWRGFITVTSGGPNTFAVIADCAKIGP